MTGAASAPARHIPEDERRAMALTLYEEGIAADMASADMMSRDPKNYDDEE